MAQTYQIGCSCICGLWIGEVLGTAHLRLGKHIGCRDKQKYSPVRLGKTKRFSVSKVLIFLTSLMLERKDLDKDFVGNNGSRHDNSNTFHLPDIHLWSHTHLYL